MNDDTYSIARRALVSALKQLDEDARRANAGWAGIQSSVDESSTQSPVIVVVLGGGGNSATSETAAEMKHSADVSHPSHQRYVLPRAHASGNSPRPCLIQPDRSCINSGCCESRGF